jgi:branched-subunit amino acid transport protein
MNEYWLLTIIIGIVTLGLRASFLLLPAGAQLPPLMQRALRFVPAAVLPALIVPSIAFAGEAGPWPGLNGRILAAVIAVIVAWRSRNVLLTIVAGMLALWLQQYLFGQ